MAHTKSPLFFERFVMQVQGVSRSYEHIRIIVWEGDADRFCLPAVRFTWIVLPDGGLGQMTVEIEEHGVRKALPAIKLAARLCEKLERYETTPSNVQALLARLRATKVGRDEKFNQVPLADGAHFPV